jgi:uncharacterized protein
MGVEDIEATLRAFFAERAEGLAAVYLFGSVARGSVTPASDVDIGVLPTHPDRFSEQDRLDLEDALEHVLGREAQVVLIDRVPVDLVHRVLRDGVLLSEPDRAGRIAFEVRARNEYFDLLPFLDRYRRRVS